MPFTDDEKNRLFDKLEDHSVALGKIETKLDFGSAEFATIKKRHTDFQETTEGLHVHLAHHKSVKRVLSILGGVMATLGTWWVGLKR